MIANKQSNFIGNIFGRKNFHSLRCKISHLTKWMQIMELNRVFGFFKLKVISPSWIAENKLFSMHHTRNIISNKRRIIQWWTGFELDGYSSCTGQKEHKRLAMIGFFLAMVIFYWMAPNSLKNRNREQKKICRESISRQSVAIGNVNT